MACSSTVSCIDNDDRKCNRKAAWKYDARNKEYEVRVNSLYCDYHVRGPGVVDHSFSPPLMAARSSWTSTTTQARGVVTACNKLSDDSSRKPVSSLDQVFLIVSPSILLRAVGLLAVLIIVIPSIFLTALSALATPLIEFVQHLLRHAIQKVFGENP